MTEQNDKTRFDDTGESIYDFADKVLVACPKCQAICSVSIDQEGAGAAAAALVRREARAICGECGFAKSLEVRTITIADGFDPYFGFPVWLQTNCCGELLWAYNLNHLALLENFVEAKHRTGSPPNNNRSMASRLPLWMKKASNRSEVLKCIQNLKSTL